MVMILNCRIFFIAVNNRSSSSSSSPGAMEPHLQQRLWSPHVEKKIPVIFARKDFAASAIMHRILKASVSPH